MTPTPRMAATGLAGGAAPPASPVAAVLLVGLHSVVPGAASGAPALLAVYLVLISALTLPHVAVVLWMDREEGLASADPDNLWPTAGAVGAGVRTGAPAGTPVERRRG